MMAYFTNGTGPYGWDVSSSTITASSYTETGTSATTSSATLSNTGFKITWLDKIKESAVYVCPSGLNNPDKIWKINYETVTDYGSGIDPYMYRTTPTGPYMYRTTPTYGQGIDYGSEIDYSRYRMTVSTPGGWHHREMTKGEMIKERFRRNLTPGIISRANPVRGIQENEQVAIGTLREMITETQLRKYLRYGFVLVKGKSGDTYQVFRNNDHTKIWRGGKLIREVCVTLCDSQVPLTDKVIARLAMIESDEEEFHKMGNVYNMAA